MHTIRLRRQLYAGDRLQCRQQAAEQGLRPWDCEYPLNDVFAKYFQDAGFTVRGMEGIEMPFDKVQDLSGEQVYAHIKRSFLRRKGADAIYMLGSGWRTLEIIKTLEQDLKVPVVHPVTARVWEIQKRLHAREPRSGYGRLLEALP